MVKITEQDISFERLAKLAAIMHCWIFLHTGDEEKAYNEIGLTEEENALFGYGSLGIEIDHSCPDKDAGSRENEEDETADGNPDCLEGSNESDMLGRTGNNCQD